MLTIGNFDGVHLGHQALLAKLRQRAKDFNARPAVLTFEPHPREFFAPASAPPRLTSLRRKLELLAEQGVQATFVQRFTQRFAALTADQFIDQILVRGLRVRHLIVGDDFCFGKNRSGNFALLKEAGARLGFTVEAMDTVHVDGERVSSSAIRNAMIGGDMGRAAALLGGPFSVVGWVLHGDKIGRTIGFPTANIQLRQRSMPLSGIFAVRVDGGPLSGAMGAASIGTRPTIGERLALRLEVFVLDFAGDLYHQQLHVRFLKKIRDEEKYDSLDELKQAIARDCDAVRRFFAEQAQDR